MADVQISVAGAVVDVGAAIADDLAANLLISSEPDIPWLPLSDGKRALFRGLFTVRSVWRSRSANSFEIQVESMVLDDSATMCLTPQTICL